MTQIVLNVEDASLVPSLKRILGSIKGVTIDNLVPNEEAQEVDTTEYLMSSQTMVDVIRQSEQDIKDGKGTVLKVEDLWK